MAIEENVRVPVSGGTGILSQWDRPAFDIGLHIVLLIAALSPLLLLYLKRKSAAGWLDMLLLIGFGILLMTGLSAAFKYLPSHAMPFLRGYALLSLVVLVLSSVVVLWRMKSATRGAFAIKIIGSLLLLGLIIGLCLPAVPSAREAAKRMACASSLKQLALLLMPEGPASTDWRDDTKSNANVDEGGPNVSWRVKLLSQLGREDLAEKYQYSQPWDSQENWPVVQESLSAYTCPSEPKLVSPKGGRFTSYAMLTNSDKQVDNPKRVNLKWGTTSDSNRILLVESCGANILWTEPRDIDLDTAEWRIGNTAKEGREPWRSKGIASSFHSNGAQVVMGDGSIRFIPSRVDPIALEYLIKGVSFDYDEEK